TGADCVVILTEWNEYRNLDLPRASSLLRTPILLDTRNVLDPADARAAGLAF
ncbi:MAG: UDP-glucose 6-dehydrogenase, partial [Spirochaetaceae bacterium]|nr:UDP-glucose 6-dehydrogenase [Spirochaetaceae bacterium]